MALEFRTKHHPEAGENSECDDQKRESFDAIKRLPTTMSLADSFGHLCSPCNPIWSCNRSQALLTLNRKLSSKIAIPGIGGSLLSP